MALGAFTCSAYFLAITQDEWDPKKRIHSCYVAVICWWVNLGRIVKSKSAMEYFPLGLSLLLGLPLYYLSPDRLTSGITLVVLLIGGPLVLLAWNVGLIKKI
jgi:hypothetical protein